MKNASLTIFLLAFITTNLISQTYSVYDLDVSSFPILKAKFLVMDSAGNQVTGYNINDFEVLENGIPRNVISVTCPAPKQPIPLSSVLTIDVSGSMNGNGLSIAKEAANAWVNTMPLGKSECAVTSFDDNNYINQDFTINQNNLLSAIQSLQSGGGTDYDIGLLKPLAGSLEISKTGKNKRVIVFLTDGVPNQTPQVSQIVAEANNQNCAIYSVVLGMNCPQSLKDISNQTGGQWFDNINSGDEAKKVYLRILMIAQGSAPCEINWESGYNCTEGKVLAEVMLKPINTTALLTYDSPPSSIAKLDISPYYVNFKDGIPGIKKDTLIKVTAKNVDFNVSNITCSNPSFMISPLNFKLKAGESQNLTVSCIPPDSGYIFTKFVIENDVCETKFYTAGGFRGKSPKIRTLKLISPNGGEEFVVGSDTIITWEGILPNEQVVIDYSIDNGKSWIKISDTATGLIYNWHVPNTPSNQCLARVTAKLPAESGECMILIPAGSFIMGNTGKKILYSEELPVHKVTLTRDYLICKHEVTENQYRVVMGESILSDGDDIPKTSVSWYEAVDFCNRLSNMEGLQPCYSGTGSSTVCNFNANGYRLPTEAEWEYACKAGTTSDYYSGSLVNEWCTPIDADLDKIGWYCGNTNTIPKIQLKQPNSFGLYDMSGGVCEWCWDWIDNYSSSDQIDPQGPATGTYKALYRPQNII